MIAMCATLYAAEAEKQEAQEAAEDGGEKGTSQAKDVDEGFARYQSILDRQPFGPPPPGFDPTQPPGKGGAGGGEEGGKTEAEISAEEQKLMSSVRVSILNVTPSGAVMAGFTDSTTQPPVNYYLKVGDTSTDAAKWTVKEADPSAGTVTLSKDGIDVTLSVGGETKKGATAGKGGAKGLGVAAADQQRGRGFMRRPPMPPPAAVGGPAGGPAGPAGSLGDAAGEGEHGGSLARLRQRRMMKQAAEVAQRQAAEKARADIEAQEKAERERREEQAAAEREQQREALRQIQEELQRQREAKEAAKKAEEQQGEEPNE